MANRNIEESLRKPRRTRGTAFYTQRNYYSLGVIALGGIAWALFELWPAARKLKYSQLVEGKFDTPLGIQEKNLQRELAIKDPAHDIILAKLRARQEAREDASYQEESQPQPWYTKVFKLPDA